MSTIELYNDGPGSDPPACFATDADIETADRLLRRLEELYFAPSASSPPPNPATGD